MRKVFPSVAALVVGGLMLHGAFACESSQPNSAIVLPGACSWSNCLVDPLQDPLTPAPVQDCGTGYFDPSTYSGSNGLLECLMASLDTQSQYEPGAGFAPSPSPPDWLMASLDTQSQYKPSAGFAPSPMDAKAQFRKLRKAQIAMVKPLNTKPSKR
jgi:hypothetical protein